MSYRTDDGWEDREMEPDYGDSRWRGHLYKALVSAGVLCAFGAAVLYAYSEGPPAEEANRSTTVPLVKAEASAVKEKPADPGGQKVPHRDSDLYKKLEIVPNAGDDAKDRQRAETPRPLPRAQNYEDILAPRDDAAKRPPPADEMPKAAPAADEVADRAQPETATRDDTAARREGDIDVTPSLRGARPAAPKTDAQLASRPAADRTEAKRTPDTPSAADAIGPYRVQLGAFRTPVKARHEWRNLIRSNRDLLGELSMVIERVDLGPKGIFYRLQAGPLRTEPAARGLCRTLDKRKVGCILVHG